MSVRWLACAPPDIVSNGVYKGFVCWHNPALRRWHLRREVRADGIVISKETFGLDGASPWASKPLDVFVIRVLRSPSADRLEIENFMSFDSRCSCKCCCQDSLAHIRVCPKNLVDAEMLVEMAHSRESTLVLVMGLEDVGCSRVVLDDNSTSRGVLVHIHKPIYNRLQR